MNQSCANVSRGTSGMVPEVFAMQPRFYSSGYHASMGQANGINAGAGAAIAAANRVANQVSATMRSALKVHSPSSSDSANPFNHGRGHNDIRKEGDKVTWSCWVYQNLDIQQDQHIF